MRKIYGKQLLAVTLAIVMLTPASLANAGELGREETGLEAVAEEKWEEAQDSDFVIDENHVLIEYRGNGGDVTIPDGVTGIGEKAFVRGDLTGITIPSSVISIGDRAFQDCWGIRSITIPSSVTSIGENIFSGTNNLTAINVEADNKIYDSRGDCNAIIETNSNTLLLGCQNTKIPEDVTGIGEYAFEACQINSITIPSGVTSIGACAFWCCRGLTGIRIPEDVMHVGERAFAKCGSLTEITVDEGNKIYDSRGSCNAVIETSSNTLLAGCQNTKIPEDVTRIENGAFEGSRMTEITIPKGVTSIGYYAFLDCSSLTSISIPEGVTNIGYDAFAYCDSLTIYGAPGSYIQTYAEENNIRFSPIGGQSGTVITEEQEKNLILDKVSLMFDVIGSSQTLTAAVTPADKASQVTWSTSNEKVATVKDGIVTATGNGTAVITATLEDKSATATVTVSQKCKKISMTLNGQTVSGTLKAKLNKTYNFKAVVSPANADKKNAKVTWSTSDKKIATVKNGKVSVKKAGTVTITARTADGKTAKIKLKAGKQKIKVTKVKLAGSKTMKVKEKQTLNLTVMPATADNGKVTWSSSNKKIATVDSEGRVTAKKKGTVTITAKAKDGSGKKGSIKIKVK